MRSPYHGIERTEHLRRGRSFGQHAVHLAHQVEELLDRVWGLRRLDGGCGRFVLPKEPLIGLVVDVGQHLHCQLRGSASIWALKPRNRAPTKTSLGSSPLLRPALFTTCLAKTGGNRIRSLKWHA